MTDAEMCRAHGWTVGTRLRGERQDRHVDEIVITAIGETLVLARRVRPEPRPEGLWCLAMRDWAVVHEEGEISMSATTQTRNTTLYRELSKPHKSPDAANEALQAFFADVQAARKRHGLPDVLIVAACNVQYPEREGRACTWLHCGDARVAEPMAAFALGQAARDRRAWVNALSAGVKESQT